MGLAVLAAGCSLFRGPPEPALEPMPGETSRVLAWLDRVREQGLGRTAVRAVGRLQLRGPGGSGRIRQVVIAKRPGLLRLESLDFLGQTVRLLVTDGEGYAVYDGRSVERGDISPDVLRVHVGLDVDSHRSESVFCGTRENRSLSIAQSESDAIDGRESAFFHDRFDVLDA